jgi:hypothetical protein
LVEMGLADHTIEPDVALPAAADVLVDTGVVLLLLLLLLLLQPATASAPTAPARAASCQLLSRRDEYSTDLCRAIDAPLPGDGRHIATTRSCTAVTLRLTRGHPREFGGRGRICLPGRPSRHVRRP